jgi:hypothetical protein
MCRGGPVPRASERPVAPPLPARDAPSATVPDVVPPAGRQRTPRRCVRDRLRSTRPPPRPAVRQTRVRGSGASLGGRSCDAAGDSTPRAPERPVALPRQRETPTGQGARRCAPSGAWRRRSAASAAPRPRAVTIYPPAAVSTVRRSRVLGSCAILRGRFSATRTRTAAGGPSMVRDSHGHSGRRSAYSGHQRTRTRRRRLGRDLPAGGRVSGHAVPRSRLRREPGKPTPACTCTGTTASGQRSHWPSAGPPVAVADRRHATEP